MGSCLGGRRGAKLAPSCLRFQRDRETTARAAHGAAVGCRPLALALPKDTPTGTALARSASATERSASGPFRSDGRPPTWASTVPEVTSGRGGLSPSIAPSDCSPPRCKPGLSGSSLRPGFHESPPPRTGCGGWPPTPSRASRSATCTPFGPRSPGPPGRDGLHLHACAHLPRTAHLHLRRTAGAVQVGAGSAGERRDPRQLLEFNGRWGSDGGGEVDLRRQRRRSRPCLLSTSSPSPLSQHAREES